MIAWNVIWKHIQFRITKPNMSSKIVGWLVGARYGKILWFKKSGIIKRSRINQEMVNTKFFPISKIVYLIISRGIHCVKKVVKCTGGEDQPCFDTLKKVEWLPLWFILCVRFLIRNSLIGIDIRPIDWALMLSIYFLC